MDKFNDLRNKYEEIIYKGFTIDEGNETFKITYNFVIPNLISFNPTISFNIDLFINENLNDKLLNKIIYRLGLIELISYYKAVCPKKIVLENGYISKDEEKFFKKIFYNGLGEFFYQNNININKEELFEFVINGEEETIDNVSFNGEGNLIPIGGGKDSCVSLELLNGMNNKCFMINPKDVHLKCAGDTESYIIKRTIDQNLIKLNNEGYLNGHTPFSAIVAFASYLVAYITNRSNIILSNEGSANEPTIIGTNINHQYSKTYEFENDFYNYTKNVFKININYFSLLRPLKEVQIAYLFSKYPKYHNIFRSCNLGSKENPWVWCCKCSKCLFIFIMLRAFLSKEEVINIFGTNLLDDTSLEKYFLELIGKSDTKPFECIGTIDEVKYALNKILDDESYLVKLYKENYYEDINIDLSKLYYENNLDEEYLNILKEVINDAE